MQHLLNIIICLTIGLIQLPTRYYMLVYTCIHTYMQCMYVCMYICLYLCMYVCMYAYIHSCIHTTCVACVHLADSKFGDLRMNTDVLANT